MMDRVKEGLVKEAELIRTIEVLEREKLNLNATIKELVLESDTLKNEACRLQKWKGAYMQFLGTLTEVNSKMHQRN